MKNLGITLLFLLCVGTAFGQDITFDGVKNGKLQFHRGKVSIEAVCISGNCSLAGSVGDSTRQFVIVDNLCERNFGTTYALEGGLLEFFMLTAKCDELGHDKLRVVNEYVDK